MFLCVCSDCAFHLPPVRFAIYNCSDKQEDLESFSDEEVLELAGKLRGGVRLATPVFDCATAYEIRQMLRLGNLSETGQTELFDGRTDEAFDRPVTVGCTYMLKLNHLVDDVWSPNSRWAARPSLAATSASVRWRSGRLSLWRLLHAAGDGDGQVR